MSWQAAVIKFQCISVNVTYLFSFLCAVTRSWLVWSWELGFKAPPCESCQLIYLFLSSGSSWCVIQKLLKEWGWVNLWFSSFESTLEVLLHILPSWSSEIGLMRLIWSPFLRNIGTAVGKVPQPEVPCRHLQSWDISSLSPGSPRFLFYMAIDKLHPKMYNLDFTTQSWVNVAFLFLH